MAENVCVLPDNNKRFCYGPIFFLLQQLRREQNKMTGAGLNTPLKSVI